MNPIIHKLKLKRFQEPQEEEEKEKKPSMSSAATWSREEDKAFENAIAMHCIEEDDSKEQQQQQWQKIASMVPSRSVEELKQHYQILLEDVNAIEAGNIPLPNYVGEDRATSSTKDFHGPSTAADNRSNGVYGSGFSGLSHDPSGHGSKGSSKSEQERRKGIPWTEEEHRYVCFVQETFHLWQFLTNF